MGNQELGTNPSQKKSLIDALAGTSHSELEKHYGISTHINRFSNAAQKPTLAQQRERAASLSENSLRSSATSQIYRKATIEINSLQSGLANYQNQNNRLKKQLSLSANDLAQYKQKLNAAETEVHQLKRQNMQLDHQLREVIFSKETTQRILNEKSAYIANLERKNMEINNNCINLVNESRLERDQHQQQVEHLKSSLHKTTKQNEKLDFNLITAFETISEKENQMATAQAKISDLQTLIQELQLNNEGLNTKIGELNKDNEELNTGIGELKIKLTSTQHSLSLTQLQQKQLNLTIQQKLQTIHQREETIKTMSARIAEWERSYDQIQDRHHQALKAHDKDKQILEQQRHAIDQRENAYKLLEEEYRTRCQVGQQQIEQLTKHLYEAQEKIDSLTEVTKFQRANLAEGHKLFEKQIIYELKHENDRLWGKLIKNSGKNPEKGGHEYLRENSGSSPLIMQSSGRKHVPQFDDSAFHPMAKRAHDFLDKLDTEIGQKSEFNLESAQQINGHSVEHSKILPTKVTQNQAIRLDNGPHVVSLNLSRTSQ